MCSKDTALYDVNHLKYENRKERNVQQSIQLPNTFRPRLQRERRTHLKQQHHNQNATSRKSKGQFRSQKNGQTAIQNRICLWFQAHIVFKKCRETIASALNNYCARWCKREHVESNALNNWTLKIFKIIDERVLFYYNNFDILTSP